MRKRAAPFRSLFWAAGFSFARSQLLREVPYDGSLRQLFFGEETSMLARMFSHGWDCYCPGEAVVYHLWERGHRPNFRENGDERTRAEKAGAQSAVRRLLGCAVAEAEGAASAAGGEAVQLGTVRSLAQLEAHLGVSFATRSFVGDGERAKRGGLEPSEFCSSAPANGEKVLEIIAQALNLGAPLLPPASSGPAAFVESEDMDGID